MTHLARVVTRPDVTEPVRRLTSGEVFVGVLFDDTEQRAAALEAALDRVVDDETRVVWVGNPLRSPLTVERFLIQVVGPEVDLRVERGPDELAGTLAQRVGKENRLLIVVQQPETINAQTRDLLVEAARFLVGRAFQVQFLFAGSTAFIVPQISRPKLTILDPAAVVKAVDPEPTSSPRRRDVLPLVLLLVALAIGVLFTMTPARREDLPQPIASASPAPEPRQPELSQPESTAAPPGAATPSPRPAPQAVVRTEDPTTLMRREFDAFLAERAASLPPLTDSQKDFLFGQFLTHHRRE